MSAARRRLTPLDSVPLTARQKATLLVEAVPVLFFAALLVLYVAVLGDVYGGLRPSIVLVLGTLVLGTGMIARRRLSDLIAGGALVDEDVLQRLGASDDAGSRHVTFERLGQLRIAGSGMATARVGRRHRVRYSPASRIAWSFEPVERT